MVPLDILEEEVRKAAALFKEAGRKYILPRLNRVTVESKVVEHSMEEVVTEADMASSSFLMENFRVRYPGSYSEEQLFADRWDNDLVWQIDPLDGTSEFCAGFEELFAVQGALLERRGQVFEPIAGLIYIPGKDQIVFNVGDRVYAGFGESEIILSPPVAQPDLRCFVRRVDGMPWDAGLRYYEQVASELGKSVELRETGGAGVAFAEMLQGKLDLLIFNIDYCKDWDTGMAYSLLKSLGGWICDIDGRDLVHNSRDSVFHDRGVLASITVPQDVALRNVSPEVFVAKRTNAPLKEDVSDSEDEGDEVEEFSS